MSSKLTSGRVQSMPFTPPEVTGAVSDTISIRLEPMVASHVKVPSASMATAISAAELASSSTMIRRTLPLISS